MAYTIKYGDAFLFYPGSDTALAHDAKLSQKSGGSYSTLTVTIPPDNPLYDDIKLHDVDNQIVLAFNDTILFRGVVTEMRQTMWLELELTCASELVFLDWVQTRYKPFGKTANNCLAELIAIYNSYARLKSLDDGLDRFLFTIDTECLTDANGINTVGYTNPYNPNGAKLVDCETSTPTSILEIIRNTMVDNYGAFLRVRYIPSPVLNPNNIPPYRAIGLFSEPPESDKNDQVIELGENLMDYDYSVTDDGMYNACLPIGATMDKEANNAEFLALTVVSDAAVGSSTITLADDSGAARLNVGCYLSIDDGLMLYTVQSINRPGNGTVVVGVSPTVMKAIPKDTVASYAYRLNAQNGSAANASSVQLLSTSGEVHLVNDGVLLLDSGVSYVVVGNYTVGSSLVDVQISPKTMYAIPVNTGVTYVGKAPFYHDKALTLNRLSGGTSGDYTTDSEIVYHTDNAGTYGIKCMTYRDSSIQDAAALRSKAIAMIEPCLRPRISLKISAIDAAYYSDSYTHLQAGQVVHVHSAPHGLDEDLYVVAADIDLQNPENTRYQLGWMESTLSRMLRDTSDAVDNETSNTMIELDNTITNATIGGLFA